MSFLAGRSGLEVVALPAQAAFIASHPAFGHRYVALYLWAAGPPPERLAAAAVDLSTQRVVPGDPNDPAIVERKLR